MSSFKGSYTYSVDGKGRINIPARLKKYVSPEANNTFTITRGFESCLFVYPQDEWLKVENSIRTLSSMNPRHRYFTRLLLENAIESKLDAQSRITIPRELLAMAGITREVRIIGVLERIEIWNPATYREYQEKQGDSYESIAETVLKQ
ncbi:MAG TPA: division/cell wall cluster transcriptional repressor MraZ [Bacteroidota bacterium]|nr:division/cell wall cluster transcriptional repressor MraZ [Bacteroidota bacterium]